jgi:two-component system sensor histidine kinase UhpB
MALGHVPLRDLLAELVAERARQYGEIALTFSADGIPRSYGDSIDLTIYRCIQEGLTNAIRHAQASRVEIALAEKRGDNDRPSEDGPAELILTIRDDGRGIAPGTPMGFGMRGMQERVQGLGGSYTIRAANGGGTVAQIAIPLPRDLV